MSNRTASTVKVAVLVAGAVRDVVQVVVVSELAERDSIGPTDKSQQSKVKLDTMMTHH